WHIECSAMAKHFLGESFDIHGGGLDLRFPHHENELAQSTAAGDRFANIWMHNALITIQGNKMSKSLGNGVSIAELFEAGSPAAIRYWLLSANYRSALDYHPEAITEAKAALDRVTAFITRAGQPLSFDFKSLPADFVQAMNNDLNLPLALAALHEQVRLGNIAIDNNSPEVSKHLQAVFSMLEVLGLDFALAKASLSKELVDQIEDLIAKRNQAKSDKDFAKADEIRQQLTELGVTIQDLPDRTIWSING
ncbi:MAG: hypothetical protein RIQ88_984, partial [Actinomycetota bacterium]